MKTILAIIFLAICGFGLSQVDMAGELISMVWFPALCGAFVFLIIRAKLYGTPEDAKAFEEKVERFAAKRAELTRKGDTGDLEKGARKKNQSTIGDFTAASTTGWEDFMEPTYKTLNDED